MLVEYLSSHGFDVTQVGSGEAMRTALQQRVPDVVLLDLNLPGEDGLSLARYLREHHDVGIIMVTAAGETIDRIVGLEVGADDYVTKPFDPRELRARLKSVLRRVQARLTEAAPTPRPTSSPRLLTRGESTRNPAGAGPVPPPPFPRPGARATLGRCGS